MCIALLSTAHPRYSLILLSNRDEFLNRPTAPLAYWPPSPSATTTSDEAHILSGRDLQRATHGTWLGITRAGRLAVLTNFREDASATGHAPDSAVGSRGEIAKTVLASDPRRPVGDVVRDMVQAGVHGVGGFSLIFGDAGDVGETLRLGLISNRSSAHEGDGIRWLQGEGGKGEDTRGECAASAIALSNSHFGDQAWPKVVEGERLMDEMVARSTAMGSRQSKEELIREALELLSTDTLPPRKEGQEMEVYTKELRRSIFIPAIEGDETPAQDLAAAKDAKSVKVPATLGGAGTYGTQKQSVVLVAKTGEVTFVERTLFDEAARPVKEDRRFDFVIKPHPRASNTTAT